MADKLFIDDGAPVMIESKVGRAVEIPNSSAAYKEWLRGVRAKGEKKDKKLHDPLYYTDEMKKDGADIIPVEEVMRERGLGKLILRYLKLLQGIVKETVKRHPLIASTIFSSLVLGSYITLAYLGSYVGQVINDIRLKVVSVQDYGSDLPSVGNIEIDASPLITAREMMSALTQPSSWQDRWVMDQKGDIKPSRLITDLRSSSLGKAVIEAFYDQEGLSIIHVTLAGNTLVDEIALRNHGVLGEGDHIERVELIISREDRHNDTRLKGGTVLILVNGRTIAFPIRGEGERPYWIDAISAAKPEENDLPAFEEIAKLKSNELEKQMQAFWNEVLKQINAELYSYPSLTKEQLERAGYQVEIDDNGIVAVKTNVTFNIPDGHGGVRSVTLNAAGPLKAAKVNERSVIVLPIGLPKDSAVLKAYEAFLGGELKYLAIADILAEDVGSFIIAVNRDDVAYVIDQDGRFVGELPDGVAVDMPKPLDDSYSLVDRMPIP